MQDLVSVIVPIYKVEDYLQSCVRSVRAQTYTALEILLVDDGSPDGCGAMCDRFAQEDARIRVIHKENGGLSSARNAGLDAASGKYVMFTDSDDRIEPEMVETLVRAIESADAEIATVNLKSVSVSGVKKVRVMDMRDAVLEFPETDYMRILRFYGPQISIYSVNNLYRRDLIERYALRFQPTQQVLSEDQLFNLCYYAAVRRAVFVDKSLYLYQVREGTLSREIKPTDILERRITLIAKLREYLRMNGFPKQKETFFALRMWTYFADGCMVLRSSGRILEGIAQFSPESRRAFRACLRRMLFGEAGGIYMRERKMDRKARLYFRAMLLLMLLGRYDRPVRTYLASE